MEYIQPYNEQHRDWIKVVCAFPIIILFLFWGFSQPLSHSVIDVINLIFHEAGHWIFWPFGQFVGILGGSLNQILIPLVCCGYFFFRKDFYSSGFMLLWAGESTINVSIYAADAMKMQLPLLGGETVIHDWHYILLQLHMLSQTEAIAAGIRILGIAFIIIGSYLCLRYSYKK